MESGKFAVLGWLKNNPPKMLRKSGNLEPEAEYLYDTYNEARGAADLYSRESYLNTVVVLIGATFEPIGLDA